jgi:hypothetical protein
LLLGSEIAKLCVSASLTDCGAIEPDELLSMPRILPDYHSCAKRDPGLSTAGWVSIFSGSEHNGYYVYLLASLLQSNGWS